MLLTRSDLLSFCFALEYCRIIYCNQESIGRLIIRFSHSNSHVRGPQFTLPHVEGQAVLTLVDVGSAGRNAPVVVLIAPPDELAPCAAQESLMAADGRHPRRH